LFIEDQLGYDNTLAEQVKISIPYLSNLRYTLFDAARSLTVPQAEAIYSKTKGAMFNFRGYYPWYPCFNTYVPPPTETPVRKIKVGDDVHFMFDKMDLK
jgi:hypothetical protein